MKNAIGVLDSGIGGVSVLKELLKEIPDADIIYFSDSKNNPYGDKTKEEIEEIVFHNVEVLQELGCSMIVLACNTATAVAIDSLRKAYPDTVFIGTEPAIKFVHDRTPGDEALLLATKLTLECERVQQLVEKYQVPNLTILPCPGLADLIEHKKLEEVKVYLKEHFTPYKNVQSVILGCTHYPLVREEFQEFFLNARIVDGSLGVSKQAGRKWREFSFPKKKANLTFIDTSEDSSKKDIFQFYLLR